MKGRCTYSTVRASEATRAQESVRKRCEVEKPPDLILGRRSIQLEHKIEALEALEGNTLDTIMELHC